VRAPDDYGATYLADSSLLDLFERARTDMPDWFAEQVDRIGEPDLPAFDAAAATGSGGRTGGSDRSSESGGAGDAAGSGGSEAGGADADGSGRGGRRSRRRSSNTNPIADVWDTE
jgi:hypothetical protein